MSVAVLLFGSALDPQILAGAPGEQAEVRVCGDGAALRRALSSAEVLEGHFVLVLALGTVSELEDILALAEYLHSNCTVCFAGREVYQDPRLLALAPRYVGVCDEHPACIREVLRRVSRQPAGPDPA